MDIYWDTGSKGRRCPGLYLPAWVNANVPVNVPVTGLAQELVTVSPTIAYPWQLLLMLVTCILGPPWSDLCIFGGLLCGEWPCSVE